jgi:hypothetical protein
MNKIEKIYRMRRNVLIIAFVCSILLFCWYSLPGPLSRGKPGHFFDRLPVSFFAISGIIAALLLLILITRYLLFKASTLKDPALRGAVDDERIRQNWLKAYRTAFYTMVGIHVAYLFLVYQFYELGLPHVGWFSATAGLMTFFGTALYYTREVKNEQPR